MSAEAPSLSFIAVEVGFWASGVLSAVIIQFLVRSFVTRADGLKSRIDELCVAVDQLATSSHSYWALDHSHPDLIKAEGELSAANDKMNALAGFVFAKKPKIKADLARDVMNLSIAATGDTFQVHGRPAQPHKYRTVQGMSSIITEKLRLFQGQFVIRTFG